jgi:NAD(P)-dependent dehydrogenase (short-subunit alcohol dehydrogenase family)
MQLLEDKVAIITGAARGIGRASAEAFATHGARVVLSDIDADLTHEATATIKNSDRDAFAFPGDVTHPEFVSSTTGKRRSNAGQANYAAGKVGIVGAMSDYVSGQLLEVTGGL